MWLRPLQYLSRSSPSLPWIARTSAAFSSSILPAGAYPEMASKEELVRIQARRVQTDQILADLRAKIDAVKKAAVKQAGLPEEEKLIKENEILKQRIESTRTALLLAEIGHGVRQVRMPTTGQLAKLCPPLNSKTAPAAAPVVSPPEGGDKKHKQEAVNGAGGKKAKTDGKEKKPWREGVPVAKKAGGDSADAAIDVSRLDFRVGKITKVEQHPDADTLYVEHVDLGEEGRIRTVVSGLRKHYTLEQMQDRVAVFMCNLKPAKVRGVLSEAMIMCATADGKTEILDLPAGAVIGDLVTCEAYPGTPDAVMNPKKKIWETLKPDCRTNKDKVASYKGAPLAIKGKGNLVAPTLADAQIS